MAASGPDIRAGRAFVELFLKNNAFLRGLANMRRQLDDFGKQMQALGMRMTSAGIAMGTPLFMATKRFADFDDAMRQVQAVSQSTDEQFRRLTDRALQLGATTSYTAVQVALLMAELGRAGFTADQIDEMTGAVLSLARATGTDATLASGIMAATIRQFGLNASQASRVADVLTSAANKSFNTVEQLGEALSYAGPVAADFNMSIEDTLAILGGLGNVGIQASNAGTALRRLLTITGAEADKLKTIFGVAFVDAAGNARPLIDVLDEVNAATKDLGTAERAKKFNEAFGLLGITAASAIGKGVGGIRELHQALVIAGGTAGKTASQMDAGLGGSFRILLSAAEGVAIGIGKSLEPAVKSIADWMTITSGHALEFIKRNGEMVVSVAKAAAGLLAAGGAFLAVGWGAQLMAAAIGGFLVILSTLSATLTGTIGLFGLLLTKMGLIVTATASWLAATGRLGGVLDEIRKRLSALSALVGVFRADFSIAWSGIVDAIKNHDPAQAAEIAMIALRLAVTKGVSLTASAMGDMWGDAVADLGERLLVGDLLGAWQTILSGMKAAWAEFWNFVSDDFNKFTEGAVGWAKTIGGAIANTGKAVLSEKRTFGLGSEGITDEDIARLERDAAFAKKVMEANERIAMRGGVKNMGIPEMDATRASKRKYEQAVAEVERARAIQKRARESPVRPTAEAEVSRRGLTAEERARKTAEAKARIAARDALSVQILESADEWFAVTGTHAPGHTPGLDAFRRRVSGRSSAVGESVASLEAELRRLTENAKPGAAPATAGDGAGGAAPAGGKAAAATGLGGMSATASGASVTFSAAGLMALGMGGTQDRMLQLTRDQKIIQQNQLRVQERQLKAAEELIDRMQLVVAFRWG